VNKKNAPRKSSTALILNGIKYKPGQKPVRVCPATRPSTVSERFLTDTLSATADHLQQLLADRAPFRSGKPAGSASGCTKYIRKLRADNPTLTSKELFRRADSEKLGSMSEGRFRNVARGARRK